MTILDGKWWYGKVSSVSVALVVKFESISPLGQVRISCILSSAMSCVDTSLQELETNLRKDFTITENDTAKAFSLKKVPTSTFT